MHSSMDRAPPERIGRFKIIRQLGEGGMGVVFEALDEQLGRPIAIKLVHQATGKDASRGQARMLREAQAMARLSHPNVVQVYQVGEHLGQVFLAMEYVKGPTLRTWQRERERSWREVLERYIEAGRGLAAAHKKGLVHCDFKPHNALVADDDGRVRVLDFGLARFHERADRTAKSPEQLTEFDRIELSQKLLDRHEIEQSMTISDTVTGTPAYMSPEQYQGFRANARSDQFSFCVALYEALYGERPFSGQSPAALAFQVSAGDIRDPPPGAKVPTWLREVILRGLHPEPAGRWPSMAALLQALIRDTGPLRRQRVRIEGINIERFKQLSTHGYEIAQPLRDGRDTVIYRGRRESDEQQVLLKLLRSELPSRSELARMRREHEILGKFSSPGVIRSLGLEKHGHGTLLVLEDFGATTLRQRLMGGVTLEIGEFLRLALRLNDALATVHSQGLIHKDIGPDHILLDETCRRVALIDFDVASQISEETPAITSPDDLEGTLHYMAPEQTGRMNRTVDYRSDYYALGVTFYEALTGQLPFEVSHPMELLHAHIAVAPTPPCELAPNIPETLSALVLKLMAKTPEGRYQSASGMRADLSRCLREWTKHGWIEDFPLATQDYSEQFSIPQLLYGREQLVELLLASFERAAHGKIELFLLKGPSGIGKSAVVREVHKPVVGRRGYFVSGKSDPRTRDIPYKALLQAFQELFRQILRESDNALRAWREELLAAVGGNGRVLIDVIPELELIIGAQPSVPDLPPTESSNRFRSLFRSLIRVIAREDRPLVLFLDDLQWSDLATLKLIERLVLDTELGNLLLVGAYRDTEVGPDHLLNQVLQTIEEAEFYIHQHTVRPLALEHTNALVKDTLSPTRQDTIALARLIQSKTDGNPFFVRALLGSLYEQQLVMFDRAANGWSWDPDEVARARLSDDIVDLLSARIGDLSERTRKALELGACIGSSFTLDLLATVTGDDAVQIAKDLWEALERGLLRVVGDAYKYIDRLDPSASGNERAPEIRYYFVHDKIQHAAYIRIDPGRRRLTHLRIGRLLRDQTRPDELGDQVFRITTHLNASLALVTDRGERVRLAELNLLAGRRAKRSIAYTSAVTHLRTGIELLPGDQWEACYDLAFSLRRELMESLHLAGDVDKALELFQPLVNRAKSVLQKAEVYTLKASLESYRKQNELAVKTALEGLRLLGVGLPTKATRGAAILELARVRFAQRFRSPDKLTKLPDLDNPRIHLILHLMMSVVPAAYFIDTKLGAIYLLRIAGISMRVGLTDAAAFGFAGYGLVLVGVLGAYKEAYAFGQLALSLNDRFRNQWLDVKLDFVVGFFIAPWIEPFAAARRRLQRAYQNGIQAGDLAYACYAGITGTLISLVEGLNLDRILSSTEGMYSTAQRAGEFDGIGMLTAVQRTCKALQGETLAPTTFEGVGWDERTFLAGLSDRDTPMAMFYYHLYKMVVMYIFRDFESAEHVRKVVFERVESALAQPMLADYYFYTCLLDAAHFPVADARKQRTLAKQMQQSLKQLEIWANICPHNFQSRLLLAKAEFSRVTGDGDDPFTLYNQAIQAARTFESINCEAVGLELTARFALESGYDVAVESYVAAACDAYTRWGAHAKVELLSQEFGDHLPLRALPEASVEQPRRPRIDNASIITRSMRGIFNQASLDRVLTTTVRTLTELTGAHHAAVVLCTGDRLTVEAEGGLNPKTARTLHSVVVDRSDQVCPAIIKFVIRSRETVHLNNACEEGDYRDDPYIRGVNVKSVLSMPLVHLGNLVGAIYLENELSPDVFVDRHIELLRELLPSITFALVATRGGWSFGRFAPKELYNRLGRAHGQPVQPGEYVELRGTVLAIDLAGFAVPTAGVDNRRRLAWLSGYVRDVEATVRRCHGFVAQRTADCLTAVFTDSATGALTAALSLLHQTADVNDDRAEAGAGPLRIGLGLHTGALALAAIGSDTSSSGVLFAEAASLATAVARRCYHRELKLLMSSATRAEMQADGVPKTIALEQIDSLEIPGHHELPLFEVTETAKLRFGRSSGHE